MKTMTKWVVGTSALGLLLFFENDRFGAYHLTLPLLFVAARWSLFRTRRPVPDAWFDRDEREKLVGL